ncbi:MAG: hypothetical protein ACI8X5_002446 [Planctomycetota bacterium]|jgi:hypothetical protein
MSNQVRWRGEVPQRGTRGLEIVFAPTRSRIVGIGWGPELTALFADKNKNGAGTEELMTVSLLRNGRVILRWKRELGIGRTFEIELHHLGEKPQVLQTKWMLAQEQEGEPILQDPDEPAEDPVEETPVEPDAEEPDDPWPTEMDVIDTESPEYLLYAELLELSDAPHSDENLETEPTEEDHEAIELSLERAFLFELDKQTLEPYMTYALVPKSERQARTEGFECLTPYLAEKLRGNFAGVPFEDAPNSSAMVRFTEVFWKAAEQRFLPGTSLSAADKARTLGGTLEKFAGGLMATTVNLALVGSSAVRQFEPDSYFVFFFAEFAFASIEHSPEDNPFIPLLPWLVRMQRFFVERFHLPKAVIESQVVACDYQPLYALEQAQFDALRLELNGTVSTSATIEELKVLVKAHLKLLVNDGLSFGPLPTTDASCPT